MKIIPLAFDSLGTRSMATYIETIDLKILIDPSVSLAPIKSGLPPHPIELKRQSQHWELIKKYALQSNILIITHYHYDHYNLLEPEIYQNKITFVKHPSLNINKSQFKRAQKFLGIIKPKELNYSDGKTFQFGRTKITFSQAVPHGNIDKLGYVTEVSITDGIKKVVHTSDIEGGNLDCQIDFIINENPNIVIFDGPMTYPFQNIIPNIICILQQTKVEDFIIDHHYVRKLKWREKLQEPINIASKLNKRIICAAEFLGEKEDLLEANRKQLYKGDSFEN